MILLKNNINIALGLGLLSIISLSSCATMIKPGYYTTVNEGKVLMAGTDIEVGEKGLSILHWTDTGKLYGEGKYVQKGNKVIVTFDSVDMIRPLYTVSFIEPAYADAFTIEIVGGAQLYGASVSAFDKGKGFVKGGAVNKEGFAQLNIPKEIVIDYVLIDKFGHESMKIEIENQSSKRYDIVLQETITEYYPAGQRKVFLFKKSGDYYILKKDEFEYFLNYQLTR